MDSPRTVLTLTAAFLVLGCAAPASNPARRPTVSVPAIDWSKHSELSFRIDSFVVPEASREAFTAAMHRNLAFIRTLEGFRGHLVFEKRAGDAVFNLVTIAAWDNREAIERAGKEVRAHYQRIGFDMPQMLKLWGVQMARADYEAPAELQ